ncbi:hypothetical protein Bca4012_009861 [Brassica carinata]
MMMAINGARITSQWEVIREWLNGQALKWNLAREFDHFKTVVLAEARLKGVHPPSFEVRGAPGIDKGEQQQHRLTRDTARAASRPGAGGTRHASRLAPRHATRWPPWRRAALAWRRRHATRWPAWRRGTRPGAGGTRLAPRTRMRVGLAPSTVHALVSVPSCSVRSPLACSDHSS